MTKTKRPAEEVIGGYRPRIRVWRDRDGEWHIGGEPDGFREVLSAFKLVARRTKNRSVVNLRAEPIDKSLNPVAALGVRRTYARLELSFDRKIATVPKVIEDQDELRLSFSSSCKYELGFALYEAIDGEGDFAISVRDEHGDESFLWFWGYSNVHGANTF